MTRATDEEVAAEVHRQCELQAQRDMDAQGPPPLSDGTKRIVRSAFTVPQLPRRTRRSA